MKRITGKDIENAIALTRERWSQMAEADNTNDFFSIMTNTYCGFCELSTMGNCLFRKCPIKEYGVTCCTPFQLYIEFSENNDDISKIKEEAGKLIKRMNKFDISAIVRTINKAIKEAKNA